MLQTSHNQTTKNFFHPFFPTRRFRTLCLPFILVHLACCSPFFHPPPKNNTNTFEKYTDSTTREYLQIYIKFEQHHFCSTHIHQFDNSSIALHCNFFIRHTFQHTQSKQSHKSGRCAIHLKINIRSTCTKPMKQ